jgi:predicted double-glycine peptidase
MMGIRVTQTQLAEFMHTSCKNGTSQSEMVIGAKDIGLRAFRLQGSTIEILAELLPSHFIIVDWMSGPDDNEDGHYELLKKVENNRVYLEDTEMSIEEFNQKWYDVEDGKRINNWAMLIWRRR